MAETDSQETTVEFSDDTIGFTPLTWDRESGTTPVFAVVSTIADANETDPAELPPLNEVIDPEALNDLFLARSEPSVDTVTFQYAGYDVAVHGSGEIRIAPDRET